MLMPEPQKEAADTEGEADTVWMQAVARQWQEELADPREDVYMREDGEPIDAKR